MKRMTLNDFHVKHREAQTKTALLLGHVLGNCNDGPTRPNDPPAEPGTSGPAPPGPVPPGNPPPQ